MKRQWGEVMPILSAFACLLCMAMVFLCGEGDDRDNVRTLQLKEAYQAQEAYEIQLAEKNFRQETDKNKRKAAEFIFWGETQEVNVNTRELNRNASAVQVAVCGDTRIIFSSSPSLDEGVKSVNADGNKPRIRNENSGKMCLISPSLAFGLFGNADGSGQRIHLGEDEYEVQGMLDCGNPVVVVPASFHPDSKLDKVSVKLSDGMGTEQGISDFASQTGIQGDILPYHLYHQWTRFMAFTVPCLLYLFVWIQMLKTIRKRGFAPAVGTAVFLTAAVTGAVIGIWILDIHIKIPREMLPAMWSDFEFWSDLWKDKSRELSLLMKSQKGEMVLHDYGNFLKAGGYTVAAAVLGYFSFRHPVIKNSIILWTASAGAMITVYLFFAANMQSSVSLSHNRILWLLMPACFVMNYISRE